ncbi:hypothetical protein ABPG75_008117 [Micractinium tetrahymenae]
MGVSGLLPQLRSITKRSHVSKYRGQKVAVDAYCLLHKGAYTCARELVEGEPTERHVAYCMARVELLLGAGVTPLVVFDGGRLPNKAGEERSRQRSREENRARARALWAAGNRAAAMECYQKAVDITPAHAKQFVEALKRRGCAFLVAPYEADAQMAYLALNGLVDAVMTEDSDLLCYGCPRVFFKMDKTGEGEEVQLCDLPQARELAFQGFGHDLFQELVGDEPDFLGPPLPDDVAQAIAMGDLDPITKLPFADELQPCTAPLADDAAASGCMPRPGAASQRGAPPEQQQQQHHHHRSGRGKSGQQQAGAANGTTLLNFGFVRGLAKPSQAEFKPPRPSSAPGSQDSAAGPQQQQQQQQAAASSSVEEQQQQQQQQAAASSSDEEQQQQQQQELGSPAPVKPAPAGDALASPTDEQWKSFRQRRHRASARAPLAAPAAAAWEADKPLGPVGGRKTSSYFASKPSVPGMRKPATAPAASSGGSLLARLRAALKPEEPSIDELLSGKEEADLPAEISVSIGTDDEEEQQGEQQLQRPGGGRARFLPPPQATLLPAVQRPASLGMQQEEQGEEQGEEEEQQLQVLGDRRPRFVVPTKPPSLPPSQQRQQQCQQERQPTTPLDLGLTSSPTLDDVLGGGSAAAAAAGHSEDEELPSPACSPLQPPRPSQRLWLPQRSAAEQQQRQQGPPLDLISPVGPSFLQPPQQQAQQQQQQQQHQITPGFYMGGGSEAGSDVRRLSSLPRRMPAAMPSSSSPPLGQAAGAAGGGGTAALQPCFDAAAPAEGGQGAAGEEGASPFSNDPIASLRHLPAFQREAEAAVDRAAQTALAAALQAALRPLPPPPHLQPGKPPSAVLAAGKRALLGVAEKENGQARQAAAGSKRLKGGSSAQAAGAGGPPATNIFSGFACGSR